MTAGFNLQWRRHERRKVTILATYPPIVNFQPVQRSALSPQPFASDAPSAPISKTRQIGCDFGMFRGFGGPELGSRNFPDFAAVQDPRGSQQSDPAIRNLWSYGWRDCHFCRVIADRSRKSTQIVAGCSLHNVVRHRGKCSQDCCAQIPATFARPIAYGNPFRLGYMVHAMDRFVV